MRFKRDFHHFHCNWDLVVEIKLFLFYTLIFLYFMKLSNHFSNRHFNNKLLRDFNRNVFYFLFIFQESIYDNFCTHVLIHE